jgi:hypothetical protein
MAVMTEGVRYTAESGYEILQVEEERTHKVLVHRLIAAAEYGVDEIVGMDIHHKNQCKFDNRPENLEVLSSEEHSRWHADERLGKGPWRSEERLREMYHERGMSLTEIGEELGCSLVTVHDWMERREIERRTPGEGLNVNRIDEDQRELSEFSSG